MKYTIYSADNGWIIEWWDDNEERPISHSMVFEIPDSVDLQKEDPQALIDLLHFIKEEVCGQYRSKHKTKNVMIGFEDGEK